MKVATKSLIPLALTAAMFAAPSVYAGESGYWNCPNGTPIKSGAGECVRDAGWKKGMPACGQKVAMAKPKPESRVMPAVPIAKAPPPAPPAPKPVVETLSLSAGALFASNSSTLTAEGKREVSDLASKLRQYDSVTAINVAGHADSRGAAAYNQQLSERRANSVKNELIRLGVNPGIVTAVGYGETSPIASNDTSAGRAQNRRVEVSVTASKKTFR